MLTTIKKCACQPCLICNNSSLKIISTSLSRCTQRLIHANQFRSFYVLSNSCLFNSTQRVLATPDNYHVPIEKSNELNYFWEDYSKKLSFKRRCIGKVSTLLNCGEEAAISLTKEHPILFLEDVDNTYENIQLLRENGIISKIIKQNVWLLYYKHDDLTSRIDTVKNWDIKNCTLRDLLNLFKLSPDDFEKVSVVFMSEKEEVPYGNRIVYLAKILQTPIAELTLRLVRHKYLLVRSMDMILASIKTYKDFGVTESELVDDIWALRYTEGVIRKRLQIVKDNNLPYLKPWYVRCSEENFAKMLEANKLEKSVIHPYATREEYLSNKLCIDLSVMKQVAQKNTVFNKIHIIKLVEMIDYLLESGFKGTEICSCSRIFYFSLDKIMERINELKSLPVERLSIGMLIKNESEYRKSVDRIEYVNSLRKAVNVTDE